MLASLAAVALPAASGAADGDVGYRGPSSAGIDNSAPTGAKPESRLWFNDGHWWGVLYDTAGGAYKIWRLETSTQTWINTGVTVDERNQSRGDALWDGTHLYVASHIFINNGGSPKPGQEARLYRYSYDAATDTYSLDAGFPVQVSPNRSEALVLEKDSTGTLWVAWAQNNQVWVSRTVGGDDRTWGVAYPIPIPQAQNLYSDDLAAMVSFGGNHIGVMWSHQVDDAFYFARHVDGAPDSEWTLETPLQGLDLADDHLNLKSDSAGRVYAAVKTSKTLSNDPLVYLLVREPAGTWSSDVVGVKADRHTRPMVMVDEAAGVVMVFATSGEAGGKIYKKVAPLGAVSFGPGKGSVFVADATSDDMNDATSSKQTVSAATGLALLASNDTTDFYWHNYDPLILVADFAADRSSGAGPLTVSFSDLSTGNPTSWLWDFGDGTASTAQNPTKVYDAVGTYTVTLTASTPRGESDAETKSALVTVTPSAVFAPSDDSWVRSSTPTSNFGKQTVLNVKTAPATAISPTVYQYTYLRFPVTGMTQPVTEAKLRLWVTDGSKVSGNVYTVGSAWTETTITWNTAPPISGSPLGVVGSTSTGSWVEVQLPVSLFAGGNGVYSFAIADGSNDTTGFSSRQGANPPQLILGIPG